MGENERVHAFQIGIRADLDEIEAASGRVARAVNRYLSTVRSDVGAATQVVVAIGMGAQQENPYRTTEIGFVADYGHDNFDFDDGDDGEDGEGNSWGVGQNRD